MTRSTILTVLFVALAALGFTPIASAHYDPVQGRWLERDPIGTRPIYRIGRSPFGSDASVPSAQFSSRRQMPPTHFASPVRFEDFNIDRQYTDGPNLYQAVIGDPVSLMDPEGLAWYWPDWANEGFLWITGGSGYTYTDCVGDCIDHWNGWMDELVAALLAAENAVPAIGTGEIRNLNPVPRLTGGRSKIGSPSKNTTNWQNLWKELPSKFKTQKVLKLLKGLGRVNIALILADGAIAASIEAHCAGHCAGWSCGGGGRYDPDHDHWFSDD